MTTTHIWWIRRDIRLQDNPALHAAAADAPQLLPLFILEPSLLITAAPKRRAFLLRALADLDRQLRARGSRLIVRTGPAPSALARLADELEGFRIFSHEDFSPYARSRDQKIAARYPLTLFPGVAIRHPNAVLKQDGTPYVVYTPYRNKWYQEPLPQPGDCLPSSSQLPPLPPDLPSDPLPAAAAVDGFPATAYEAQHRLTTFINDGIRHYQSRRDTLALDGASRLSPYLRFGLLSPRECFAEGRLALIKADSDTTRAEVRAWLNELIWREFYTAILHHFPRVMEGPFRKAYVSVPWRDAPADLEAWQQGQTGYPIVDACMRQLLATGWMHNRGRMIVASFLTKDLLINWQAGEAWFMANLIDGDPAANNGGWQWSAGTGTDAAPYFRIFNPVLQGKKFDPEGAFIARWAPELRALPVRLRHEPWKISPEQAGGLDFHLGKTYPKRIVDHAFARERTLAAYRSAKNGP